MERGKVGGKHGGNVKGRDNEKEREKRHKMDGWIKEDRKAEGSTHQ